MTEIYGPDWRATLDHDGRGLTHRPLGPPRPDQRAVSHPVPRYDRETVLLLLAEADELAGRLRRAYLRRRDPRVLRCYGRAEMRWLRRAGLRQEEGG